MTDTVSGPMFLSNWTVHSPSLSLGFWMLNWEKHTETRSCLQHYYIKCSPLEQCHIDCTLKSPGTLKTYSWVGLGSQNWFNWFEMGPAYGTLKQSYLMVLRCSQSPQSTALKKRFTNSPNFQYRAFWKCLVFCYFRSLLIQQFLGFHKILQYLSSKSVKKKNLPWIVSYFWQQKETWIL